MYRGGAHNVDDPAFVQIVWFTPASAVATSLYPTERGSMAGRGRGVVNAAGRSQRRPFSRSPELSDALEPVLSKVLTVATAMAHATLPLADVQTACARMDDLKREVPARQRAYQYPHRYGDRPIVNCHQFAAWIGHVF